MIFDTVVGHVLKPGYINRIGFDAASALNRSRHVRGKGRDIAMTQVVFHRFGMILRHHPFHFDADHRPRFKSRGTVSSSMRQKELVAIVLVRLAVIFNSRATYARTLEFLEKETVNLFFQKFF